MTEKSAGFVSAKYLNPVYPHSFPDPFVLKFRGEYYAYCTDFWRDGRVFGVLRSRDLVSWTEIGGAMGKLETDAPFYWAAEVTYWNGKFYMYYSVGNETLMELRVAVSDRPDGNFVDAGVKLTTEDFAIDAHVFIDTDGAKYLFYATDFLSHSHIGTGTVVDKMLDFFTLEGNPRPVTRAKYDWQIYDANRREKGGVRWHTVEGAFVLKRKGIYYEMFSGGNWQNPTYGVSFATTDDIEKREEWTQFSDGERVFPILKTVPGVIVGPGHNSVVRGANNRELYCIYHRWSETGRVLAIDRMDFAGKRIFIKGATHTPQIAPFTPSFVDYFDRENLNENWRAVGDWKASNNGVSNQSSERSELVCVQTSEAFLCEFSVRAIESGGAFGFALLNDDEKAGEFLIHSNLKKAVYRQGSAEEIFDLPEDFNYQAFHLLRVETDCEAVKIRLDDVTIQIETLTNKAADKIALVTDGGKAAFSGFSLTKGYEDLFEWQDAESGRRGWRKLNNETVCRVKDGEMFFTGELCKGAAAENFEFAANLKYAVNSTEFGFLILNENDEELSRVSFEKSRDGYCLTNGESDFSLAENFAPENYHQFRFLKLGEKLLLQSETIDLGEIAAPAGKLKIGLFSGGSEIVLEMARLTIF